ncbi:MAG: hypothetical protein EPN84_05185 [Legionella sp.]|nr:MAG: hypothetical protein EPN84_05185 [Legionella sp.]
MSGCKLSPVGMGLAIGVFWGLYLLVMGLLGTYYAYGHPFISAVGTVYIGYEPSLKGSFIGALIGLVDGFLDGFVVAWLYNRFRCGRCDCCAPKV